jgi:two-component system, LytTR family, sensor kinase
MTAETIDAAQRTGLRPREIALIVVFWTFLAALIAANRLTDPRAPDRQVVPASGPILLTLFEAYLWAALTPLIFRLASRFGISRRGWLWRLPLLLGIGVGLALLVTVATTLVRLEVLDLPRRARAGPTPLVERFLFLNDFIIYLGVLSAGFAREYFRRYEARHREAVLLQAEAAALRAQLAEARLAALRMQLNPHFLFNTLHAISALVDRDPAGVRRMIARLSDLLRSTLEDGAQPERSLEQELAFLSRYLEIMQVRFQGKLDVAIDVDPETRDALVPTLILQPLVENAVKHGVTGVRGGGRIEVRARREGGQVVLTVRDTGPGPVPAGGPAATPGVGLRNTAERLRQMYGEADALSLRAAAGGGAVAEIRIPYRPVPREDRALAASVQAGRE